MKIIRFLLILALLLPPSLVSAQTKEETAEGWYPFHFPEKLDPDSPYNVGKLVLDAPAGKHGFVTVKDGHFYFENGTRAKFWGTNLCFSACFPTHKQAEMLAERIAYFGFNAVRLHHMDFYFEPNGIFQDVCPAYKDPQMKKTGVLSKTQLDRLDYLIYQLKQRGVYIDMNLLVSRHFTEADGVKHAEELGMAAKPVSMFDPKLIELQKQYARDLLTHLNPYTKLRYSEDPVVALIEITNENSIIPDWKYNQLNGKLWGLKKGGIPEYYSKQLDEQWNAWLKEKYSSIENVKKAWTTGIPPTSTTPIKLPSLDNWLIEQHQTALIQKTITNNIATLKIEAITGVPWHLQFKTYLPVQKDRNYLLKFTATADRETTLGLVCQQSKAPWTNLGLSDSVKLSPEPQIFELPFSVVEDYANAKLAFLTGYSTGTIALKDVSLEEMPQISIAKQEGGKNFKFDRPLYKLLNLYSKNRQEDIRNFYIDLEKSYFAEIMKTLREDIKCRVPVTGIGGFSNDEDALAQIDCDFLDKHTYWDHPRFPNKPWDKNDFRIHNKSMLADPDLGMCKVFKEKNRLDPVISSETKQSPLSLKPWTLTEWNHCYPNQYAYESPVLMATKAKEADWNALFQFAFTHGAFELNNIQSYFDIIANPQQLILCASGSLLFLKGESSEMSVGEVKNSGSGWTNGRFDWGKSPILLRRFKTQAFDF